MAEANPVCDFLRKRGTSNADLEKIKLEKVMIKFYMESFNRVKIPITTTVTVKYIPCLQL